MKEKNYYRAQERIRLHQEIYRLRMLEGMAICAW